MIFRRLLADRRGATAIEYALIAMLIAIPIVGAATGLGAKLASAFVSFASAFKIS